jgi:hypothetical protein
MVKGTISIPKNEQACKDGKCGHVHDYPFTIEEPPIPEATIKLENRGGGTVQMQQPQIEATKTKTVVENFVPAYHCPDGNCGAIHKNKNYTVRPKGKCEHCGQFARDDKGKCPWCSQNEIQPISEDDLDELGIPKAESYGHTE